MKKITSRIYSRLTIRNNLKTLLLFSSVVMVVAYGAFTVFSTNMSSSGEAYASSVQYVSLTNEKAVPDTVRIPVGNYVQFNSMDGNEHNLAEGGGNDYDTTHSHKASGMESGVFGKDEAYKVQFKKAGIYFFHDHFNPDSYITVIVFDQEQNREK